VRKHRVSRQRFDASLSTNSFTEAGSAATLYTTRTRIALPIKLNQRQNRCLARHRLDFMIPLGDRHVRMVVRDRKPRYNGGLAFPFRSGESGSEAGIHAGRIATALRKGSESRQHPSWVDSTTNVHPNERPRNRRSGFCGGRVISRKLQSAHAPTAKSETPAEKGDP
jgi:hypothetical protein